MYNGPSHLRSPVQSEKYGLILKGRGIYIENIRVVSLIAGLKIEGILKWRGLKSQGPLYIMILSTESKN